MDYGNTLSQSNDNADCVDEENRFKICGRSQFFGNIILPIGISSYNIKAHVPSNMPAHNQFISSSNLKSQSQLESINKWTNEKKMKLNVKKRKQRFSISVRRNNNLNNLQLILTL